MARLWLYILYIGLLLYTWSMAEASVSLAYQGRPESVSLIVALWGFSWFVSYRVALLNAGSVEGRRRTIAYSSFSSAIALILSLADRGEYLLTVSYMLSTAALALGTGSIISSILRGEPGGDIAGMIFKARVYPGIVHAGLVLASALVYYHPLALASIILLVAALIAASESRPLIPAVSLEVIDRFTDALLEGPSGVHFDRYLSGLAAFMIAVLSIARILYLPGAIEGGLVAGMMLYAVSLMLGAFLGSMVGFRTVLLVVLVSSLVSWMGPRPYIDLAVIVMLFSLLDVKAFLATAMSMPSRIPELSWRISILVMMFSLVTALAVRVLGEPRVILLSAVTLAAVAGLLAGGWRR
ncbi:MAG: hypothetical protein GSR73_02995 [Desulfurococcales archaeon]|nr:hypothetical protein [Desulfurococcales archaeon]